MWFILVHYTEGWELSHDPFKTKEEALAFLDEDATVGGPSYALAYAEETRRISSSPNWEISKVDQ